MPRNDTNTPLSELKQDVEAFIDERNWRQFHDDPKNTLISLVIEAGELLEHFRFTSPLEAQQAIITKRKDIEDEVADILYNLLMFCAENKIDVTRAFDSKMKKIREKYPVEQFKDRNLKYNQSGKS